jgi:hypothetical protein
MYGYLYLHDDEEKYKIVEEGAVSSGIAAILAANTPAQYMPSIAFSCLLRCVCAVIIQHKPYFQAPWVIQ